MDSNPEASTPEPRLPSSCEICHDFQPVLSNPKATSLDQWLNRYDIEVESLKADCHWCRSLKAIFHRLESILVDDYGDLELLGEIGSWSKRVWLTPESDDTAKAMYLWTRKVKPGERQENNHWTRIINIRPADEFETLFSMEMEKLSSLYWNPKSEASLEFLKDQLRTCETGSGTHERCVRQTNPILPTRVVEINFEDDTMRLHEPRPDETGPFVALSHCWGPPDKRPIRTTNETISQMKESIPWESLSAVFQDAIYLCKRLDINYIWIDSLCIIQDDKHDWEVESAQMARYYSEAHLTIAVETSPDGTVPFLREADDRWQPMVYSTVDQTGYPCTYLVQEHHSNGETVYGLQDYYKSGCKLLQTRAWTLQESVLSSRIAHFTPSTIIWHCNGMSSCYDAHRKLNGHHESEWNAREAFYALYNIPVTEQRLKEGAYTVWKSLVWQYSQRIATFAKDRLPAISGIAAHLARFFPGRYLGGIWETHLPYGLCWTRENSIGTSPRPHLALEEGVAPTWSWVSLPPGIPVETPKTLYYTELEPFLRPEILEASCTTSEAAPFGQVRDGYILIEAPLFEVTVTCTGPMATDASWLKYRITFGSEIVVPTKATVVFTEDSLLAVENGKIKRATRTCHMEYRQDPSTFQATAWALWMTGNDKSGISGLVLGRDDSFQEYRRVGHLEMADLGTDILPSEPARSRFKLV